MICTFVAETPTCTKKMFANICEFSDFFSILLILGSSVVADVHFRDFEDPELLNYWGFWILNTCIWSISDRSIIPENLIPIPFSVSVTGHKNTSVADVFTKSVLFELLVFQSQLLWSVQFFDGNWYSFVCRRDQAEENQQRKRIQPLSLG
jgi:hypothetical protein